MSSALIHTEDPELEVIAQLLCILEGETFKNLPEDAKNRVFDYFSARFCAKKGQKEAKIAPKKARDEFIAKQIEKYTWPITKPFTIGDGPYPNLFSL